MNPPNQTEANRDGSAVANTSEKESKNDGAAAEGSRDEYRAPATDPSRNTPLAEVAATDAGRAIARERARSNPSATSATPTTSRTPTETAAPVAAATQGVANAVANAINDTTLDLATLGEPSRVLDEYTKATILATRETAGNTAAGDRRRYPGPYSSDQPTPYEQSDLAKIDCGPSAEGGFYNARDPYYPIHHERAEHRVICYLKAQGLSIREVAEKTGFTPVAVSNIVRQPWAQKIISDEIRKAGRDELESVLKGEALDSVYRLVEERDNPKARAGERIAAANSLLDRLLGKPTQRMDHSIGRLDEMSDDELANLALGGSTTSTATSESA